MFFLAADKRLETQLATEYQSVSRVETNPDIHVVTFYDGLNSAARYTVFDDGQVVGPIRRGEVSTGDPATLAAFISWAKFNFPAQNYVLILSGHGHGLGGVTVDQTSYDFLKPKELKEPMVQSGPVDVLVMATPLTANLEMAHELRGLADYYAASQSVSLMPRSHDRYALSISQDTTPEEVAMGPHKCARCDGRSAKKSHVVLHVRVARFCRGCRLDTARHNNLRP